MKNLNKLLIGLSSIFLISGNTLAIAKHTQGLSIHFNNPSPMSFVAIQTAECWKIENDSKSSTLNIPSQTIVKIGIQPTCTIKEDRKNIYKLNLANGSIIAVRDMPNENKRCIGVLWKNTLLNHHSSNIYCQSLTELERVRIDYNLFTPSETNVFKYTTDGKGKVQTQKLEPTNKSLSTYK